MVMSIAGILLIALFIVVPAGVGVMLIWGSRRRGAPYPTCGKCAYDLSGTIGAATRCPECGSEFAEVGIVPPRGRRKPTLLWSGVGLVAVALTFGTMIMMSVFMAVRAARAAAFQQQLLQQQLTQQQLLQQQLLQQQLTQVQSQQATERDADDEDDGNSLDEPDSP